MNILKMQIVEKHFINFIDPSQIYIPILSCFFHNIVNILNKLWYYWDNTVIWENTVPWKILALFWEYLHICDMVGLDKWISISQSLWLECNVINANFGLIQIPKLFIAIGIPLLLFKAGHVVAESIIHKPIDTN